MITTTVYLSSLSNVGTAMLTLQNSDSLLREICTSMIGETFDRIHKDGQKADGSQIGQYSTNYLKLRQKAPYKRSSDPKVILVLTSDMSNNYSIVPLSEKEYALGFTNPTEAQKADWLEERYGKIWALTEQELEGVHNIIQEFINNAFKE